MPGNASTIRSCKARLADANCSVCSVCCTAAATAAPAAMHPHNCNIFMCSMCFAVFVYVCYYFYAGHVTGHQAVRCRTEGGGSIHTNTHKRTQTVHIALSARLGGFMRTRTSHGSQRRPRAWCTLMCACVAGAHMCACL